MFDWRGRGGAGGASPAKRLSGFRKSVEKASRSSVGMGYRRVAARRPFDAEYAYEWR
jgi:hypothetical protein